MSIAKTKKAKIAKLIKEELDEFENEMTKPEEEEENTGGEEEEGSVEDRLEALEDKVEELEAAVGDDLDLENGEDDGLAGDGEEDLDSLLSDTEEGEGEEEGGLDIFDGEEGGEEEEEEELFQREDFMLKAEGLDLGESFAKMFEGQTLTEEFKNSAKSIFESVVVEKVNEKIAASLDSITEAFNKKLEKNLLEVTQRLDEFLEATINEWMEANQAALQSNMKVKVAEETIAKLRNVLEESYITLPEIEFQALEVEKARSEAYKSKYGSTLKENADLKLVVTKMKRERLVEQLSEGMTELSKEKFKTLVEEVKFINEEDYVKKITKIKDVYLKEDTKPANKGGLGDGLITEEKAPSKPLTEMDIYAQALQSMSKRI